MCRSYRHSTALSPQRKRRLFRLLSGIVAIPMLLGWLCTAAVFLAAKIWLARRQPPVDPEGWPQVAWIVGAGALAFVFAQIGGLLLMFRRFLAYRTAKHGRAVALGDVLKPTDALPGR